MNCKDFTTAPSPFNGVNRVRMVAVVIVGTGQSYGRTHAHDAGHVNLGHV